MNDAWNPRYIAYARAKGRTPQAQFDSDSGDDRLGQRFQQWVESHRAGFRATMKKSDVDHGFFDGSAFTEYLEGVASAPSA